MEIFSYHEGLGKLVEIGNSGMFRPEVLETLGLPYVFILANLAPTGANLPDRKDMRVFGFGLSLERPTMIKYGISNIRELLGHKVDLGFVQNSPAVQFSGKA